MYTEVLTEEEGDDEQDDYEDDLYCITKRHAYRETIPLDLPARFLKENARAIQAGKLHVSIPTAYIYLVTTTALL